MSNTVNFPTKDYILNTSREYAIYVCDSRGIPFVTDGFKEGQRIALWLLRNRAEKLKTYALSGLMGYEKLYVHGETSANNTIGLLAAPFKNNVPLIHGLGQFGNRVAPVDGIGAPRYTDVKRSKAAEKMVYNDLDIVPLKDNYDGSNKMPVHFLPLIPTVLLNGIKGVAVGWSTDIQPRKLSSLIDQTINALDGNTVENIPPYYEKYNIKVKNIGQNQWQFYGRAEIVDTSTVRVTELPPGLSIEDFRKRLIDMEDCGDILNFIDRSTESIDITIKLRRGAAKAWKEDDAIRFFKLREKVTERIVVVGNIIKISEAEKEIRDNTDPKKLIKLQEKLNSAYKTITTYDDPTQLIKDFVNWRLGWYTTRFIKLKKDAEYELLYWLALDELFKQQFFNKLGKFNNKQEMFDDVKNILSKANIFADDTQIEKIINLATYKWTKDFHIEVKSKIIDLRKNIKEYTDILSSPKKQKEIYKSEIESLRKEKF